MNKDGARSATNTFTFFRHNNYFEQVQAYYDVTQAQLYLQSLGFMDVNNEPQHIRTNTIPDDNSFYDPSDDTITFGRGGVDDAEDQEVVWHELGHAIQDDQVPGFGAQEQGGSKSDQDDGEKEQQSDSQQKSGGDQEKQPSSEGTDGSTSEAQSQTEPSQGKPSSAQQQALSKAIDQQLAQGGKPDKDGKPAAAVEEDDATQEKRQALDHLLQRVPDDPGGLLRRKFQLEALRRQQGGQIPGDNP